VDLWRPRIEENVTSVCHAKDMDTKDQNDVCDKISFPCQTSGMPVPAGACQIRMVMRDRSMPDNLASGNVIALCPCTATRAEMPDADLEPAHAACVICGERSGRTSQSRMHARGRHAGPVDDTAENEAAGLEGCRACFAPLIHDRRRSKVLTHNDARVQGQMTAQPLYDRG
jgi:hypothetical protein